MTVLGICGQSGAGKTTALGFFEKAGATVCDSDLVSRRIMASGTPCADEVVSVFGEEICLPSGEIDRRKLGGIVFGSSEKLSVLTEITHRYIKKEIRKRIEVSRNSGVKLFVLDAPLLFESGLDADCDITLALIASREVRLKRIMSRDGIDEQIAQRRIDSQLSERELKKRAHEVIENNSDTAAFIEEIESFAKRRGLINE